MNCKRTRLFKMRNKSKELIIRKQQEENNSNFFFKQKNLAPTAPIHDKNIKKIEKKNKINDESLIPEKNKNDDKNLKNLMNIKSYMEALNSKPLKGPKCLTNNGIIEYIHYFLIFFHSTKRLF